MFYDVLYLVGVKSDKRDNDSTENNSIEMSRLGVGPQTSEFLDFSAQANEQRQQWEAGFDVF